MAKKSIDEEAFGETKSASQRVEAFRSLLNKKAGCEVSFDLQKINPTIVKDWIPTGSRWLDSIICNGKMAGIPMGKCCEIAGLESTGKSYLALQIIVNAIRKGYDVAYFDSESAIDLNFLEKMGISPEDFLYIQATSCEFVCESIETLISTSPKPMLFVWDSVANTPTKTDIATDFDPLSSMAVKARILSKAFQKLNIPLANHGSTLLVVNQLKTNITNNMGEKLTDPYVFPGGKAAAYNYFRRLWLTSRHAKSSFVRRAPDDKERDIIGSSVKIKIKKSVFG